MLVKQKAHQIKNNAAMSEAGFKACVNILEKWQCSAAQIQNILQLSKNAYYRAKKDPASANFSRDQLERMSIILNIHAALRVLFSNPDNVYQFMSMQNNNVFFEGRTPLEIIETGSLISLYQVYQHIDTLRNGGW
ncbi:MbcA/ParS/Xre antitoxin family protein [Gayadomonas joobiniege]|uniref:MbcA/ParS/Xre antitoxin family protein n=1 Tax=Gayadomonas joobiniege TaxID=1234606 RepID=UPI00035D9F5E|nr:MbcA/ParS/Xre antitoxin family protein [Gayadomonas joobiniege]